MLKKRGAELYAKVKQFEHDWLSRNVRAQVQEALSPALLSQADASITGQSLNERRVLGERFLKTVKDVWHDHQVCMAMLADVLMYLVSEPDRKDITPSNSETGSSLLLGKSATVYLCRVSRFVPR